MLLRGKETQKAPTNELAPPRGTPWSTRTAHASLPLPCTYLQFAYFVIRSAVPPAIASTIQLHFDLHQPQLPAVLDSCTLFLSSRLLPPTRTSPHCPSLIAYPTLTSLFRPEPTHSRRAISDLRSVASLHCRLLRPNILVFVRGQLFLPLSQPLQNTRGLKTQAARCPVAAVRSSGIAIAASLLATE